MMGTFLSMLLGIAVYDLLKTGIKALIKVLDERGLW